MGHKLRQSTLTIHIACAYIDTVLLHKTEEKALRHYSKHKYHLLAIAALLLASKYDELDDNIPLIRDFEKLTRFDFKFNEILEEESQLVQLLEWQLQPICPIHFTNLLLGVGVVFENEMYILQSGGRGRKTQKIEIDEHLLKKVKK